MIKKRLIKMLSNEKKYIFYQVFWQWLSLLCQILLVYAAARLIESAYHGTMEMRLIEKYVLIMGMAILGRFIFSRQATYASYQASANIKIILRDRIYEKLLKLGVSYRESIATSAVVQVAVEGVEQLEIYFGRYLPQLFYGMLAPLTLFVILSFVDSKASIVLLVCVPLIPVSIVFVQKIAKKLLNKYWGIYTGLGDSFLENLQGLTTLKIYQADKEKAAMMDEEAERFRKITMKVLLMQLNSISVMDIIAYAGAAVGMIVALSEYRAGHVNLSGALMIILLAAEFFIPLRLLGSLFHIAMNGMTASDKIFMLLDLTEPDEKTGMLGEREISIQFDGVYFAYEKEVPVLKGISMDIPSDSFTAFVGISGCGKSTIANLILGRSRNYQGKLLIQGQEMAALSEKSLMQSITLVNHNSYLLKGSVRENLLMGNPKASDEELKKVLLKVNLWKYLEMLSGLDTDILEKGSNFSGGQCQRLALARALLHDTPVYIFDEATSNIDVESEELILGVIKELAKSKTIILISHRLASVVEADKIYMINDGQVVQAGRHEDLMRQDGVYRELFDRQSELEMYTKNKTRELEPRKQTNSSRMSRKEVMAE